MRRFTVAGVFDRTDEDGRPYFSPDRLRIVDAGERDLLSRYLASCPLVVAGPGFDVDPLAPERGPVVPMGYRSDGVWVWPEAVAYYVREYGVTPHAGLHQHVCEVDHVVPEVSDDVLVAAGDAAFGPVAPEPARFTRYFASVYPEYPADKPAGLLRQWWNEAGSRVDQALGRNMRWHSTARFIANDRSGEYDHEEIDERAAAAVVDRWWRQRRVTA